MYTLNIVSVNPQTHLKIKVDVEISHPLYHHNTVPGLMIFLTIAE